MPSALFSPNSFADGASPYFEMRSMLITLCSAPALPSSAEKSKTSRPVPVMAFFTVDSKAKASVMTVVSVQNTS